MIVTPNTKTVTTYTIELDETDAAECLSAPYEFAEHIGAFLRLAGVIPAPGDVGDVGAEQAARRKTRKAGRHPKVTRAARPASKNAGRPRKNKANGQALNSLEPLQCPNCPKQIARKYLPNHIRKVHPGMSGAISLTTASQEAAPAAA